MFSPGSPERGVGSWVALAIKGERSELTRLFPPFRLLSLSLSYFKANLASIVFNFEVIGMALRWSLRAGYRPPFVHSVGSQKGRLKCFPVGARVTGLSLRGLLTSPLPGPARLGLASPGGFGVCRSASGAPLPGRWGSPLFVFCPSSFSLFFVPTLESRLGRKGNEPKASVGCPCWLK